jgi:hypothetical protein
VENLLGDFEYEVQVPYLLYRNAAQEVNGIWFYNARECEEVANLFSRYCFHVLANNLLDISLYAQTRILFHLFENRKNLAFINIVILLWK